MKRLTIGNADSPEMKWRFQISQSLCPRLRVSRLLVDQAHEFLGQQPTYTRSTLSRNGPSPLEEMLVNCQSDVLFHP
jgi:hypothetical protein